MSASEERVGYNPSASERALTKQVLNEGLIYAAVKSIKAETEKEKPDLEVSPCHPRFGVEFQPLKSDNADDKVGRSIRGYYRLPFAVPEWETAFEEGRIDEETYNNWLTAMGNASWNCHQIMRALAPDVVPATPFKVDGVLTFNGNEIDSDAYDDATREALDAAGQKADELYNDGGLEAYEGQVVILEISYKTDENGEKSRYPNIDRVYAEIPVGKDGQPRTVLTGDDVVQKQAPKAAAAPAKGAKSKGKGKAAKN